MKTAKIVFNGKAYTLIQSTKNGYWKIVELNLFGRGGENQMTNLLFSRGICSKFEIHY